MEKLYTEEEVKELLEKQRSICYRGAKLAFDSTKDGSMTTKISKESIMSSVLEI